MIGKCLGSGLILALTVTAGCSPGHSGQYAPDDYAVAHGPSGIGLVDPGHDAAVLPHDGGPGAPPEDAWVRPGVDAAVTHPDAWVGPDAWVAPSCPSYTSAIVPIYTQHCATCHTTGRDPRFGTSYSVANQGSSACGSSMAACTIQLGRPGGSMASRDRLGGFSSSEIATIQSWIDCGRPM